MFNFLASRMQKKLPRCLLYQLLTGRPPVWADSELEEEGKHEFCLTKAARLEILKDGLGHFWGVKRQKNKQTYTYNNSCQIFLWQADPTY